MYHWLFMPRIFTHFWHKIFSPGAKHRKVFRFDFCHIPLCESYLSVWRKLYHICNKKIHVGHAKSLYLPKYRPLNLSSTGLRPCETMQFKSRKIWRNSKNINKNELTQSRIVHCIECWSEILKELWWSHASLQSYCIVNLIINADVSTFFNFGRKNSVRTNQITMALQPYSIHIRCTVETCKLIFNWASLILTYFEPHSFTWSEPSWPQFNSLYLGSYEVNAMSNLDFRTADPIYNLFQMQK